MKVVKLLPLRTTRRGGKIALRSGPPISLALAPSQAA